MSERNVEAFRFTTAPEAYDYGATTTVETFQLTGMGGRVEEWRKVRIHTTLYRIEYQCGRYGSGLHPVRLPDDDPRNDPYYQN
jgi:hypothetical protein